MKILFLILLVMSWCWGQENDEVVIIPSISFTSQEASDMVDLYQSKYYKYTHESKAREYMRRDCLALLNALDGLYSPTAVQCLRLHQCWQARYEQAIVHNVWGDERYRTWAAWVIHNPRDVVYFMTGDFIEGFSSEWKWLKFLVDRSPQVEEEEADMGPLMRSYTNGFYVRVDHHVVLGVLSSVLDRAQVDIASILGRRPTCDTRFIQQCADLHSIYQNFARYVKVSPDWWDWVIHNPECVGLAFGAKPGASISLELLMQHIFEKNASPNLQRIDSYFAKQQRDRSEPPTARGVLAEVVGAENAPVNVQKAKASQQQQKKMGGCFCVVKNPTQARRCAQDPVVAI